MLWKRCRLWRVSWLWAGLAGGLLVATLAVALAHPTPGARLTLVRSDERMVELELDTPPTALGRRLVGGRPVPILHGEGFRFPGADGVLPVRGVLVGVPAGVAVHLEVEIDDEQLLPAWSDLVPDREGEPPSAAEITNEAWLRDLRVVRLALRPLTGARDGGALTLRRHITVRLRFDGNPQLGHTRPDPHWEPVYAQSVLNWPSAARWRVAGGSTQTVEPNPLAATGAWKVAVDNPGWQVVRAGTLIMSGLRPGADPHHIRLYDNNVEVPLYVTGSADGRLDSSDELRFYGQTVDTRFTGTNTYWLTVDSEEPGLRMGVHPAPQGAGTRLEAFTDTLRIEQEILYDPRTPGAPGDDRFFWRRLVAGGPALSATHEITFTLPGLTEGPAHVRLRLKGMDAGQRQVQLTLNGYPLADRSWAGAVPLLLEAALPDSSQLVVGENLLEVHLPGSGPDAFFVDWLEVDFPRDFNARGEDLEFTVDGEAAYVQVDGLADDQVVVLDVTDPGAPLRLLDVLVAGVGPYVARFDGDVGHRYYIAARSNRHEPPVELDTPADLVGSRLGADVIIVPHTEFRIPAVWLRGHRFAERFRVRITDLQDVYDTFSDGEPDPAAIRALVATAFATWLSPPPMYVVLLGDGHYDYRHYVSETPWFVPPFMTDLGPGVGETATDNAFVTVSGEDILPDLAVGRLAVNSRTDAYTATERIRAYEQDPVGAWIDRALFVADDGPSGVPEGEDYASLLDDVADALPPWFAVQSLTLGDPAHPSPEAVRNTVSSALAEGRALVAYLGEGSRDRWAAEGVWRSEDAQGLTNENLPVVLGLTSGSGFFADPRARALSEYFTDSAEGGAVAAWSATGTHVGAGLELMGRAWVQGVYNGARRGGAAAVMAKIALFAAAPEHAELIHTLTWLGDPALVIAGTEPRDPGTPTPVVSPESTPSATVAHTPTGTPTATVPPSPTSTPTPSSGTALATGTATPAVPTASPTPTSAASVTTSPTIPVATPTPTGSATATSKPSPGSQPTGTPSPSAPPTVPYIPGEGSAVYVPVLFRG